VDEVPRFAAAEEHPETLLADYLAARPGASERLVGTYAPVVRGAIARYLALHGRGRVDLAEDLTHEVFLALFRDDGRKLRKFEGRNGCSLAGWLRVVAVRFTIDTLRRERRLVSLDDDSRTMTELRRTLRTDEPSPEDTLTASEIGAHLQDAIRRLAPKDRLLVELHVLRGAPLLDVAAALGVTANAAYVRKSRVLERLRRNMRANI
jgi:RNA polymerase sigma factor (sigma-70 family)